LDGELWQRLIDALKEFAERADSGSPRTVEAFVRKLDGLASLATVTEQHEILEELIGTLRTEYGSEPKEGAGDQAAALASALTSYFGDVA
jgi:RecB family exonuclease